MLHINLLRLQYARSLQTDFVHSLVGQMKTGNSLAVVPTLWKRLIGQYQFRTKIATYYPDRKIELKSNTNNNNSNNVQLNMKSKNTQMAANMGAAKTTVLKPIQQKSLPKDYYYKVLGVNRHATVAQIRSSFYALAKRYHPDSTHSEQKLKHFQELSNAYNILTDETKRLEYDQLGGVKDEQAFLEQAGNPMQVDFHAKNETTTQSTDDLMKLASTELELPLSFVEATIGCKKRLDLRYLRKCESCNGKSQLQTNREVGKELCRRCNGTGKISKKTLTYTSVSTCSQCKGKRYVNRSDCEACGNRGFVLGSVEVLVHVPSGSRNGETVTIENPKTKQHVNYKLSVPASDYFRRVGNDIHTDKLLTISEAILGGNFKVQGLYEDIDVFVEAGTQSHTQIVLQSKGVRSREGIGNHIVTLKVRIPSSLSMKQRQLVLGLAKAEDPVFNCKANN